MLLDREHSPRCEMLVVACAASVNMKFAVLVPREAVHQMIRRLLQICDVTAAIIGFWGSNRNKFAELLVDAVYTFIRNKHRSRASQITLGSLPAQGI